MFSPGKVLHPRSRHFVSCVFHMWPCKAWAARQSDSKIILRHLLTSTKKKGERNLEIEFFRQWNLVCAEFYLSSTSGKCVNLIQMWQELRFQYVFEKSFEVKGKFGKCSKIFANFNLKKLIWNFLVRSSFLFYHEKLFEAFVAFVKITCFASS